MRIRLNYDQLKEVESVLASTVDNPEEASFELIFLRDQNKELHKIIRMSLSEHGRTVEQAIDEVPRSQWEEQYINLTKGQ
jgi:hypothetical protein